MVNAHGSWEDHQVFRVSLFDAPDPTSNPSSPRSTGSFDPNHISAFVETITYHTPSPVPNTMPEVDPKRSPVSRSVESGRAERWAYDGIWRLPNGTRRPRNIYNDPDSDYEGLPPSGDDDLDSDADYSPPFA